MCGCGARCPVTEISSVLVSVLCLKASRNNPELSDYSMLHEIFQKKSSCTHLSSSIFNKSDTKQDRKRCGMIETFHILAEEESDVEKEMLGAIAGVPVGPGLVIHFYGKKRFETKPLFIAADSFPICAEDVCKRCAVHLTESLGRFYPQNKNVIGPAWLPIFGLYGANHQQQLWVPEYHVFEPSASPGQESFYFRIKVRFSKDKLKYYFGIISDYLYLQVADDFRNGRLWSHFDAEINDVSSLSRNVVLELISSAGYSVMIPDETKILTAELKQIVKLQNIKSKIKFVCFWKNVPKNMPPKLQEEFRLDPLMRYLMFEHLKRGLGELFELWKTSNLAAMRQQFLEDIFTTYAKNYGLEHYSAKKVLGDRVQEVDVIIRPYAVGCRPGLHFAETHVCSLQDINDIRILENESGARTQSRQVLIYRSNMLPLLLEFDTRQAAESFVSVLETYRRLLVNYYDFLSVQQVTVPSVEVIKVLHSFGPLRKEEAIVKVDQGGAEISHSSAGNYLIYQDQEKFDLFHVLGSPSTSNYGEHTEYDLSIAKEDGKTVFKLTQDNGFSAEYSQASELRIDLSRTLGKQIHPSDEPCGAMTFLKDEGEIDPYDYSDTPQFKKNPDQPILFEDSMIPNQEHLAHGHFSEVYRSKASCLGEEVIVKKIKEDLKFQEKFCCGVAHLHDLRKVAPCFVRFYGQMLRPPLCVVFESVPYGNLQDYMQKGFSLNWLQIASILYQLANCLYDLKKCKQTYRNFCSQKILIFKESPEKLHIKLGDPGAAFYRDSLEITDQLNIQRLPWIAVERFSNLQAHTIETEMYSIGTTIWEILWNGADPNSKIPPKVSSQAFFEKSGKLPHPYIKLQNSGDDSTPTEMLLAEPPNQQLTRQNMVSQWVAAQDFTKQSSEVLSEETEDKTEASLVNSVAPPATHSADSSKLESGQTETTFLTGTKHVHPGNSEELLKKIMEKVVVFMGKCWSRDPMERPSPNDMLRVSTEVTRMAEEIMSFDQKWQITLLHQVLQDTGKITNKDAAEKLVQTLAAKDNQGKEIYQELLEKCAADMFIMSSRLEPDEDQGRGLGEGNFGQVRLANLVEPTTKKLSQEERAKLSRERVAVKFMKGASPKDQRLFVREVINSIQLKHSNIVTYIGIVIPDGKEPMKLVMEYVAGGTLEKYVKKKKHMLGDLSLKMELKKIAMDIASGMKHLNKRKMVHGDLAARNVLLSVGPSNELIGKVSDFGLAHKLTKGLDGQYHYSLSKSRTHSNIPLPVFWMAPELLEDQHFTNKTDVWSFGTVLWEMYSGGDPSKLGNKDLKSSEVIEDLKRKYKNKQRLQPEEHTPQKLYEVMKKCWADDPDERPTFSDLKSWIGQLNESDLEVET